MSQELYIGEGTCTATKSGDCLTVTFEDKLQKRIIHQIEADYDAPLIFYDLFKYTAKIRNNTFEFD